MSKSRKSILIQSAVILTLMLSGCSSMPETYDETRSWSAQKLYSEAKDELQSGNYEKAIKFFEALEARYPYGKYAQQAQLEIIYAYYKDNEFTKINNYIDILFVISILILLIIIYLVYRTNNSKIKSEIIHSLLCIIL